MGFPTFRRGVRGDAVSSVGTSQLKRFFAYTKRERVLEGGMPCLLLFPDLLDDTGCKRCDHTAPR